MHVDAATRLGGLPDPDRYLDNVLVFADPGRGGQAQPGPAALWQHWWRRRVTADEPVATAARQGFVLTTAQLDHLGVTRATARHAVATGRWSVPFRGTVAVVDVRDGTDKYAILRRSHALHAAGATLRRPDRTVSGRSAAILHALPTLIVPELAEMTTPDAAGLGTLSVHTFGAALTARDVARWFGVPVTDVARSLVDLARHDRRDGLMAGDAALREKLVRPAELAAALDQAVGWPGVRQARGAGPRLTEGGVAAGVADPAGDARQRLPDAATAGRDLWLPGRSLPRRATPRHRGRRPSEVHR